jgi:hypothetical protein
MLIGLSGWIHITALVGIGAAPLKANPEPANVSGKPGAGVSEPSLFTWSLKKKGCCPAGWSAQK